MIVSALAGAVFLAFGVIELRQGTRLGAAGGESIAAGAVLLAFGGGSLGFAIARWLA